MFHFWRVATPNGAVYVGIIQCPAAGGGILEVQKENKQGGFEAFQQKIKDSPGTCRDTGLHTTYISTLGDRISYNRGKATVNGQPWPLHGYALHDSPFLSSAFGSGVIGVAEGDRFLRLVFRNESSPLRIERTVR